MKNKLLYILLVLVFVFSQTINVFADTEEIVCFGGDLSDSEKNELYEIFSVDKENVREITVTIDEEKQYLEGLISEQQIGSRSISSAYVKTSSSESGISVETHNITWVSKEMYANAMATAGISDAEVIVAAPFKVSGTAALTGIMKAFEDVTGETLSDNQKQAANEEIVVTGDLGDEIGQDKAAELIKEVKEKVVEENAKTPEEIKQIVINVAADLDINLSEDNINQLVNLMEKISALDLDLDSIKDQLDKISKTVEENKGLLKDIWDGILSFFNWVADLFK
jgi:uncharacterized protein YpuA (DUF1002 family)